MIWLDTLRRATHDAHEALHHHPLLAHLSGEGLTVARFEAILQAFELYYRAAEAAIKVPVPASLPNAPVRDWLAQDMTAFRVSPVPDHLSVPTITTPSHLMGYLYAKQGSTLGGRVISKHIEQQLGLRPLIDQHFFAGYGADNGPQWKQFVAFVDATEAALVTEDMSSAATAAFDGISRACDHVFNHLRVPASVSH